MILAVTLQGSIGLLDAGSHSYSTLMRSHTAAVQSMSLQEGGGSGSSGGGGSGSSGGGGSGSSSGGGSGSSSGGGSGSSSGGGSGSSSGGGSGSSSGGSLVTCSHDHTIRVWDVDSGAQVDLLCVCISVLQCTIPPPPLQLFDFRVPGEVANCVCFHPSQPAFAAGFQSGALRLFHTPSTTLLGEHRSLTQHASVRCSSYQKTFHELNLSFKRSMTEFRMYCSLIQSPPRHHHGSITGLLFSPSGHRLYCSTATGTLALYDTTLSLQDCRLLRLLGNTVAKGDQSTPHALSMSEDGRRLAFVGPLDFTITVLAADSLNELLRVDITPMITSHPAQTELDPARSVARACIYVISCCICVPQVCGVLSSVC